VAGTLGGREVKTKWCKECKRDLPATRVYFSPGDNKSGLYYCCRDCKRRKERDRYHVREMHASETHALFDSPRVIALKNFYENLEMSISSARLRSKFHHMNAIKADAFLRAQGIKVVNAFEFHKEYDGGHGITEE
jgi:hypothetical protein